MRRLTSACDYISVLHQRRNACVRQFVAMLAHAIFQTFGFKSPLMTIVSIIICTVFTSLWAACAEPTPQTIKAAAITRTPWIFSRLKSSLYNPISSASLRTPSGMFLRRGQTPRRRLCKTLSALIYCRIDVLVRLIGPAIALAWNAWAVCRRGLPGCQVGQIAPRLRLTDFATLLSRGIFVLALTLSVAGCASTDRHPPVPLSMASKY